MLKKRLGIEAIEVSRWNNLIFSVYKIPSSLIIPEGVEKIGNRAFGGL